jgi:hypothetical protein
MQPSLYAEHPLVAILHLGSWSPDLVLSINLAFPEDGRVTLAGTSDSRSQSASERPLRSPLPWRRRAGHKHGERRTSKQRSISILTKGQVFMNRDMAGSSGLVSHREHERHEIEAALTSRIHEMSLR